MKKPGVFPSFHGFGFRKFLVIFFFVAECFAKRLVDFDFHSLDLNMHFQYVQLQLFGIWRLVESCLWDWNTSWCHFVSFLGN